MIKLRESHRWSKGHKRRKGKGNGRCDSSCDGLDCCDGPPCLDFGLFSTLLLVGASVAELTSRPLGHRRDSFSGQDRTGSGLGRTRSGWDRLGSAAIQGYRRWLSPHWPGHCRFTPTCSGYGLAAVERHGLAVGGRLAAARVRRCRPEVPCGTADPLR